MSALDADGTPMIAPFTTVPKTRVSAAIEPTIAALAMLAHFTGQRRTCRRAIRARAGAGK